MSKFWVKTIVRVMYSQKTWDIYKTGVWAFESLVWFFWLLTLYVGVSVLMLYKGVQIPIDFYSLEFMLSLALVVTTIAYYRSLKFNPEIKIAKLLEMDYKKS